jgi:hypothetical protein
MTEEVSPPRDNARPTLSPVKDAVTAARKDLRVERVMENRTTYPSKQRRV